MSTLLYLKHVLKDKHIASVTPTSSAGVRRVCRHIEFDKPLAIVEYGPALGVFSRYLLDRMHTESRLVLIERNPEFAGILTSAFDDPRVSVYAESAEDVKEIVRHSGLQQADYVISGIPFSFFSDELRDTIVKHTADVLKPGGVFLPYQTFFQPDKHLLDHLHRYFATVHDERFLYNVPPMRIYEAIKGPTKSARPE